MIELCQRHDPNLPLAEDKTSKTQPAGLKDDFLKIPDAAPKPEVVGSQAGRGNLQRSISTI